MDKVKMISTGTHRYGGVWHYATDTEPFDVDSEQDADELKILGFAKRVAPDQTYETRVLVAGKPGAQIAAVDAPRQKRAYNRRNLAAE